MNSFTQLFRFPPIQLCSSSRQTDQNDVSHVTESPLLIHHNDIDHDDVFHSPIQATPFCQLNYERQNSNTEDSASALHAFPVCTSPNIFRTVYAPRLSFDSSPTPFSCHKKTGDLLIRGPISAFPSSIPIGEFQAPPEMENPMQQECDSNTELFCSLRPTPSRSAFGKRRPSARKSTESAKTENSKRASFSPRNSGKMDEEGVEDWIVEDKDERTADIDNFSPSKNAFISNKEDAPENSNVSYDPIKTNDAVDPLEALVPTNPRKRSPLELNDDLTASGDRTKARKVIKRPQTPKESIELMRRHCELARSWVTDENKRLKKQKSNTDLLKWKAVPPPKTALEMKPGFYPKGLLTTHQQKELEEEEAEAEEERKRLEEEESARKKATEVEKLQFRIQEDRQLLLDHKKCQIESAQNKNQTEHKKIPEGMVIGSLSQESSSLPISSPTAAAAIKPFSFGSHHDSLKLQHGELNVPLHDTSSATSGIFAQTASQFVNTSKRRHRPVTSSSAATTARGGSTTSLLPQSIIGGGTSSITPNQSFVFGAVGPSSHQVGQIVAQHQNMFSSNQPTTTNVIFGAPQVNAFGNHIFDTSSTNPPCVGQVFGASTNFAVPTTSSAVPVVNSGSSFNFSAPQPHAPAAAAPNVFAQSFIGGGGGGGSSSRSRRKR